MQKNIAKSSIFLVLFIVVSTFVAAFFCNYFSIYAFGDDLSNQQNSYDSDCSYSAGNYKNDDQKTCIWIGDFDIQTGRICSWLDASSWENGVIPGENDIAVFPERDRGFNEVFIPSDISISTIVIEGDTFFEGDNECNINLKNEDLPIQVSYDIKYFINDCVQIKTPVSDLHNQFSNSVIYLDDEQMYITSPCLYERYIGNGNWYDFSSWFNKDTGELSIRFPWSDDEIDVTDNTFYESINLDKDAHVLCLSFIDRQSELTITSDSDFPSCLYIHDMNEPLLNDKGLLAMDYNVIIKMRTNDAKYLEYFVEDIRDKILISEEPDERGFYSFSLPKSKCLHSHTHLENIREATCFELGYTGDTFCNDCGSKIAQGQNIPKNPENHIHIFTIQGKSATCTTTGLSDGKRCEDCNKTLQKQEIIPIDPNNHDFNTPYQKNKEGHWNICSRCGAKSDIQMHEFSNYVCDICKFENLEGAISDTCDAFDKKAGPYPSHKILKLVNELKDKVIKITNIGDVLSFREEGLSKIELLLDEESANKCDELILKIGYIDMDSDMNDVLPKIKSARDCYNKLSDHAKLLVKNVSILIQQENNFKTLEVAIKNAKETAYNEIQKYAGPEHQRSEKMNTLVANKIKELNEQTSLSKILKVKDQAIKEIKELIESEKKSESESSDGQSKLSDLANTKDVYAYLIVILACVVILGGFSVMNISHKE